VAFISPRYGAFAMTRTFAYLDPGSASMILQMIVGGVAAAGVAIKLFWDRILRFLHLKRREPETASSSEPR
jgi:hypothetical protein